MKLVFATHNLNKLKEIKELVPSGIEILSLTDISCTEDIEETGVTLEENAKIKVDYIKDNYGYECFADDSGLEIDALDGAPGVYSARYAGAEKSNKKNIEKVWAKLADKKKYLSTIQNHHCSSYRWKNISMRRQSTWNYNF